MNENNTNLHAECENMELKEAVYRSKVLMNQEFFYDFQTVSYNRLKKIYLLMFFLAASQVVINILAGQYDQVVISLFISLLMVLMFFKRRMIIKRSYNQNMVSMGKEIVLCGELFEDKVVSAIEGLKREYFYHQITKLFETKDALLLHLQHHVYVTISKKALNADVDEVKSFLLEKCSLVKKKKFIDCTNDKKWSLILLVAMILFSVVGSVVALNLKINGSI